MPKIHCMKHVQDDKEMLYRIFSMIVNLLLKSSLPFFTSFIRSNKKVIPLF